MFSSTDSICIQYCADKNCEEPSSFTPTKNAGEPNIIITNKDTMISGVGENGEQISIPVKYLFKDNSNQCFQIKPVETKCNLFAKEYPVQN